VTSPGDDLDVLRTIVGPDQVLTDPDVRASYELDWTRRFRGHATAVVRPARTQEVAERVVIPARRVTVAVGAPVDQVQPPRAVCGAHA